MSFSDRIQKFQQLLNTHPAFNLVELTGAILLFLKGMTGWILNTPKLLIYVWFWIRLRGIGWQGVGLLKPSDWKKVLLLSVSIGMVYLLYNAYFLEPLFIKISGDLPDLNSLKSLMGNIEDLIMLILGSWIFGAFGEEIIYRGYLLNLLARTLGQKPVSWILAVIISSIFYGFAHSGDDLSVKLMSMIHGLVFASLYFYTERNLWCPILAHGIHDTFKYSMVYLNIYP